MRHCEAPILYRNISVVDGQESHPVPKELLFASADVRRDLGWAFGSSREWLSTRPTKPPPKGAHLAGDTAAIATAFLGLGIANYTAGHAAGGAVSSG